MTKLFIDCDPGLDDAIAILMAGKASNLNLLGVSSVAGNQTVDKTTENARRIVGLGELNCPVVKGAQRPLLRDPIIADDVHGESGLEGIELPPKMVSLTNGHAVPWLAERILAEPDGVTLVPIGPLTNIALLFSTYPEVKEKIQRVVMMGGSMTRGNVTPSAEFNVLCDPEAAKIVIHSGVPIFMVGLDATQRVQASRSIVEKIRSLNNSVSEYISAWLTFYINANYSITGLESGALHDPLTVASLIQSDVVRFQEMYVDVETRSELTYGQTVCDVSGVTGKAPNVQVAVDVDQGMFWDIFFDSIGRY